MTSLLGVWRCQSNERGAPSKQCISKLFVHITSQKRHFRTGFAKPKCEYEICAHVTQELRGRIGACVWMPHLLQRQRQSTRWCPSGTLNIFIKGSTAFWVLVLSNKHFCGKQVLRGLCPFKDVTSSFMCWVWRAMNRTLVKQFIPLLLWSPFLMLNKSETTSIRDGQVECELTKIDKGSRNCQKANKYKPRKVWMWKGKMRELYPTNYRIVDPSS